MKKAISSSSSNSISSGSVSEDEDIEKAQPKRRQRPKRHAKAIQQPGELTCEHFWALFLLFVLAVIVMALALCEVWPPPVKALSDIAARRRALIAIGMLEVMGMMVFVVMGYAQDVCAAAMRCLRLERTRRAIRFACDIFALIVLVLLVSVGLAFWFVPA